MKHLTERYQLTSLQLLHYNIFTSFRLSIDCTREIQDMVIKLFIMNLITHITNLIRVIMMLITLPTLLMTVITPRMSVIMNLTMRVIINHSMDTITNLMVDAMDTVKF